MISNKRFSLSSLAAASLFGWTLFFVLTFNDVQPAILTLAPFLAERGSFAVFCLLVVFFSAAGILIFFQVLRDFHAKAVLRILLSVVFMMAAIPKILDPSGFALDISHYDALPRFSVNLIAITLPWVEALIAISLISGIMDRGGVLLTNLLMVAFLLLTGQAWFRGLDIDCGCFGHEGAREAVSKAFLRDIFFIFWSALLFFYLRKDNGRKTLTEKAG